MVPTAWCEGVFLYLHLHLPNVRVVATPHYLCPVLSALSISLRDSSKRRKSTYLNRTHLMINTWNLTIYSFCPYPRKRSACLLFLCFLTLVNSLFLIQRIQNRILTMPSMCSAHNTPQSFQIEVVERCSCSLWTSLLKLGPSAPSSSCCVHKRQATMALRLGSGLRPGLELSSTVISDCV